MYTLSNKLCLKMSNARMDGESGSSFEDYVHSVQREKEKRKLFRRNKDKMFSILLKKRVIRMPAVYEMSINDSIAAHAFVMAGRDEVENSRQLLKCFERLYVTSDVGKVLKLLLSLRDSGPLRDCSTLVQIGDGITDYKNIENFEDFPYGTRSSLKPSMIYKNYPKDVFTFNVNSLPRCKLNIYSKTSFMLNEDPIDTEIFNLEPKLGIDTDTASLFFRERSKVVKSDELVDEGYISPEPQEDPTQIWDRIWEVEIPRRRTWERLGVKVVGKELPYLSEVGEDAVHHAWTASKYFLLI